MKDFRPDIRKNLRTDQGMQDYIEALNNILNDLDVSGFDKLVQNFCTQTDPDRADDFLFEICICRMLRRNQGVQTLQYEPPDTTPLPDFRFLIQGVSFDLQVKRLHQIENEIIKRRFERECRQRLSNIQKPWLINFSVADHFTKQHLHPFFDYLKQSINQFSPVTTRNTFSGQPQYSWKQDGRILVQFFFVEKPSKEPGISPGAILLNGLMKSLDANAFHKGVERLLKKSRKTLTRPVSAQQANLLIMQVIHPILSADKRMPGALYRSNGLFYTGKFSKICGLVLVHPSVWCLSDRFEGTYFPHLSHLQNVKFHQKPFEEMKGWDFLDK